MLGEGHSVRSTSPKGNFENCAAVTVLIARPDTTISALASACVSFGFSLLTSVFLQSWTIVRGRKLSGLGGPSGI